jgi:hypothetical protein
MNYRPAGARTQVAGEIGGHLSDDVVRYREQGQISQVDGGRRRAAGAGAQLGGQAGDILGIPAANGGNLVTGQVKGTAKR